MIEALLIMLALLTGAGLGVVFYGGLWFTVKKGFSTRRSALWFFVSQVARACIVLAGFYFVGRGHWERLLVCVLGFIAARIIVTHFTMVAGKTIRPDREARHAP